MLEFIFKILNMLSFWGVFLGLAVEAASIPFPAALLVLTYGYLLNPSWGMMVILSITGSLIYAIFSYIPYFIGLKLQSKFKKKKYEKKIKKVQMWFNKYGEWTISLSRIIGFGNYISYFSGISKVRPLKFGALTYIGVLPWLFLMLLLGRAGFIKTIIDFLSTSQKYILLGTLLLLLFYLFYRIKGKYGKTSNSKKST